MNYDEALEYINAVPRFAKTNTLERVREILSAFGSPEKSLNCIHVAGTNGKGSTVMMLSNIFRAAGKRVGTFVSPFVYDFRERIQLDCAPIEKQAFADICSRVRDVVNNLLDPPNAFEILTATALIFFSEAKCDIVVLEVGLGGTWDATNVISTPMLAVICSIALDHMAILGNTLPEIAHEKCGIIKNGGVVVTGSMHESDVMAIIEDTCKERGATLITAHSAPRPIRESVDGTVFEYNGESVSLSLPGEYQLANVALVIAAAEALTLPTSAVIRGL
ncbi:MAG: Mur ligase family protein, partial [Clostridia bacterium]